MSDDKNTPQQPLSARLGAVGGLTGGLLGGMIGRQLFPVTQSGGFSVEQTLSAVVCGAIGVSIGFFIGWLAEG